MEYQITNQEIST